MCAHGVTGRVCSPTWSRPLRSITPSRPDQNAVRILNDNIQYVMNTNNSRILNAAERDQNAKQYRTLSETQTTNTER